MTTGRIFADNGLLGSFFSHPPRPISPFFAIKLSLASTIQTFSTDDGIISGQTQRVSACLVNFRCTSNAARTHPLAEFNPARASRSERRKIRRDRRFIPGDEKLLPPAPRRLTTCRRRSLPRPRLVTH